MRGAATDEGLVVIRGEKRALVLTPEPADDFVTALLAAAPDARRERVAAGRRR